MPKPLTIEEIDPNMKVEKKINEPDIVFYDVREEPFVLYGFYQPRTEADFKRLPDNVANSVSAGVARLALNTAGGRVRFSTDSQYVAIRAEMPQIAHMDHFALTGSSAFDLFLDDPETQSSRFCHSYRPGFYFENGYESIKKFSDRKMRHFTIHFPTYSNVRTLLIGVEATAKVDGGMPYRHELPVVYYGSSITQGGCASRPGNTYQSVISRRLGIDHLNLGFSGSGKGENAIADYMAGLDMLAFVCDYDHNAPSVEHLRATHCRLYQKIRATHPDIPYIMISQPDFFKDPEASAPRRDVIIDTYRYAREQGDRNVYFIDGESIFKGEYQDMCTVDGCHPNDLGFALMADTIGATLKTALAKRNV